MVLCLAENQGFCGTEDRKNRYWGTVSNRQHTIMLFHSTGDGRPGTCWHSAPGSLGLPLTCSCVLLSTPYHKTRTTLRSRRRNSLGRLLERAKPAPRAKPLPWHSRPLAVGFLTCHNPMQPLPSLSEPPPAPFLASPDAPSA